MKKLITLFLICAGLANAQQSVTVQNNGAGTGTFNTPGVTTYSFAGSTVVGIPTNAAGDVSGSTVTATGSTTPRTLANRFAEVYNAKDWGATGNGVTNDSTAIQNAINAANTAGGGVVVFSPGKYSCNVIVKSGVQLVAESVWNYGYLPSTIYTVEFIQAAAGFVVDTPSGATTGCAVNGINFEGKGSATAGGGVRFQNVSWGSVRNCHFNNFADQAIYQVAGLACDFTNNLGINCLLNRTRAGFDGVLNVQGTDDYLFHNEMSASEAGISSGSLYVNAICLGGANHFVTDCVGEISDAGFVVNGTGNIRVENCRADLNWGHGWNMQTEAQLSNCTALNNSQATTNTYSGFYAAPSTCQAAMLSNCVATSNITAVQKYGFEDHATYAATAARNFYQNCASQGQGTAITNLTNNQGSPFQVPNAEFVDSTTGSHTVSVAGTQWLTESPASAATITNFTAGVAGQELFVIPTNANLTIAANSNIETASGNNITALANVGYHFFNYDGVWVEVEGVPAVATQLPSLGIGTAAPTTGLLAFPSGTTNADAIFWGTDTSLYRTAAGVLKLDGNGSAAPQFIIDAVTGSSNSTLILNARNSGTLEQGEIFVDQNGAFRIWPKAGGPGLYVDAQSGSTNMNLYLVARQSGTAEQADIFADQNGAINFAANGSAPNFTIAATSGKVSNEAGVTTAGIGITPVVSAPRTATNTNAVWAPASYTVGSSDSSYEISANINVTAASTAAMTCTCVYTDETNTSRTLTLGFTQLSGATILTSITNVTGTGPYESLTYHIRCKASTTITFATAGTVTSITYNAEANAVQLN